MLFSGKWRNARAVELQFLQGHFNFAFISFISRGFPQEHRWVSILIHLFTCDDKHEPTQIYNSTILFTLNMRITKITVTTLDPHRTLSTRATLFFSVVLKEWNPTSTDSIKPNIRWCNKIESSPAAAKDAVRMVSVCRAALAALGQPLPRPYPAVDWVFLAPLLTTVQVGSYETLFMTTGPPSK